jgi:hypothetical protein
LGVQHFRNQQEIQVQTLRNLALAAAATVLVIGAASAQDTAKPTAKPEAAHRHGQHGQHGCHGRGERHDHQKDEKHEHDRR